MIFSLLTVRQSYGVAVSQFVVSLYDACMRSFRFELWLNIPAFKPDCGFFTVDGSFSVWKKCVRCSIQSDPVTSDGWKDVYCRPRINYHALVQRVASSINDIWHSLQQTGDQTVLIGWIHELSRWSHGTSAWTFPHPANWTSVHDLFNQRNNIAVDSSSL